MGRGGLLTFFPLATAKCITNFSNCNYVVGSCNTTCNYVVIFSIKFHLRCRRFWHNLQLRCYVLDQVPTTLLTLETQLVTTLLSSFLSSGTIDAAWPALKNYIPNSLSSQSRDLLLQAKSWQSVPFCSSRRLKHWNASSDETMLFFRFHKNHPMKMSCYCGKTRRCPNFSIHFLGCFSWKKCVFRRILIFWETRVFTNIVSGPGGNLCFWPSKQQTH